MDTRTRETTVYVLAENLDDVERRLKEEDDFFVCSNKTEMYMRAESWSEYRVFEVQQTLKISG